MNPNKRNPDGLVSKKPIALRLMPAELASAEAIAGEMGISKSNLARQAFLAGLPIVAQVVSSPAVASPLASAGFNGGEALASPAVFSSTSA